MEERQAPFHVHLVELRQRLVKAALGIAGGVVVCWIFRVRLFDVVSAPIREGLANNGIYRLTAIEITETVFVYLKLAVVGGIIVASPIVLHQVWAFVAPGLRKREKHYIVPITLFSVIFFALGVLFCHRVLLPFVTDFLAAMTLGHPDVTLQVTVQSAFSFSLSLLLAFGVAFELPLLLFFLSLTEIVTPKKLLGFFRYFLVLSFVVGALFTPPDPMSQVMMAAPLNVLYLLGVGLSTLAIRQRRRTGEGMLSVGAWLLLGVGLLGVAAGIGYLSLLLGERPDALSLVPADARLVAGLRWADRTGRPTIVAVRDAWVAQHPDDEPVALELSRRAPELLEALDGDVTELLLFQTAQGQTAVLVIGDFGAGDPLTALQASLGDEWQRTQAGDLPVLIRRTAGDLGAASVVVTSLTAGVLGIGELAALESSRHAQASGAHAGRVANRKQAVVDLRRLGPLWAVVWRDPLPSPPSAAGVLADWDRAALRAWIELGGEVTVRAELDAGAPGSATALAASLGTWRERAAAATQARDASRAAARARDAAERRTAARLDRLVTAVQGALVATRGGLSRLDPEAGAALQPSLAELGRLRTELAEERTDHGPRPAEADAPAPPVPFADVAKLEASAVGRRVDVETRLAPAGAAKLLDRLVFHARGGLPPPLPGSL